MGGGGSFLLIIIMSSNPYVNKLRGYNTFYTASPPCSSENVQAGKTSAVHSYYMKNNICVKQMPPRKNK